MVIVSAPLLASLATATASPTPTPSVSPTTVAPGLNTVGTTLTWDQVQGVLIVGSLLILLIGVVVALTRAFVGDPAETGNSLVRGWMALILVGGLVLLCVLAFAVNDLTLRNTLIGGLIASVSAVSAFYFSSKTSDKARQDLLDATFGEIVPDLTGKTQADARTLLSSASFSFAIDPGHPPTADGNPILTQNPLGNSKAPRGTKIVASF
jgi:hypothetical protein